MALIVAGVAALAAAGILALGGGSAHTAPSGVAPPSRPAAAATAAAAKAPGGEGESPLSHAHGALVPPPREPARRATAHYPAIHWRHSVAVGLPFHGSLRNGTLLPAYGRDYVTWDPVLNRYPNRANRRWATPRLIRTLLYVLDRYRRAHPGAPRVLIGDLSRPHGGPFTGQYGGLGHASHQNGLDMDILYPRKDRKELPADPQTMDRRLARELVNRFVNAYARYVFVGPHTGLHGKPGVVETLVNHDDHMHVRIYPG